MNNLPASLRSDQPATLLRYRWPLSPLYAPHWAKDKTIANKLINARAETIHKKPSFKNAFKKQRCLVLADGFYEWKKEGTRKQPYYFHLKNHEPFVFAGIWDENSLTPDKTFFIITTEANETIKNIHHRMPVILTPDQAKIWLSEYTDEYALHALLAPFSASQMLAYPVDMAVNSGRINEASLIKPLSSTPLFP
ncbi:MAG: SOS response-associated peptidase [bacterium]|nr:SOS response-associated peptidase [bacterium]